MSIITTILGDTILGDSVLKKSVIMAFNLIVLLSAIGYVSAQAPLPGTVTFDTDPPKLVGNNKLEFKELAWDKAVGLSNVKILFYTIPKEGDPIKFKNFQELKPTPPAVMFPAKVKIAPHSWTSPDPFPPGNSFITIYGTDPAGKDVFFKKSAEFIVK